MGTASLREGLTERVVFEYVGPGYVMGVPARDLTEGDLVEVREREGIGVDVVEGCGLYVRVEAGVEDGLDEAGG